MIDDVDLKSETKNLNDNFQNDIQHKKLFNLKNFQKNKKLCKRDASLNRRKKNMMHD